MNYKKIMILLICLFAASVAFTQTGTVSGFVYDKENGEPVIFTNVYLEGTTLGMATDVNGYFNITSIT